jgi:hypothetical protein
MKWQNFLAGTRNSSQETPYMAYLVITIDIRKDIGPSFARSGIQICIIGAEHGKSRHGIHMYLLLIH